MPRRINDDNNNHNRGDKEVVSREESGEKICRGKTKKGPWTLSEDIMLREYVMKYGEGNWNSVQKNSGLARCGKSCRLRWANHLRPNLKKGSFSKDEEDLIVQLHAKLGNKWARMAAQLPGRTDNEIKNFWNTRVKRCQRAGLPLYPPQVLHEANVYHLQQHLKPQPSSSSSSSFSFSPLFISSSNNQEINQLKLISHPPSSNNNQQNPPHSSCLSNPQPYPQFKFPIENPNNTNNANLGFPLSPISTTSSLFNQSYHVNNNPNDYHLGSYNYSFHSNNHNHKNAIIMPNSPFEVLPPLIQGSNNNNNNEACLSQSSPPPSSTTPTSSYASGNNGYLMGGGGASSMVNNVGGGGRGSNNVAPPPVSRPPQEHSGGLLGAVVVEAQSLCNNNNNDKSKSDNEDSTASQVLSHKRKWMVTTNEECAKEEETTNKNNVVVESDIKSNGNTTINNKIQKVDMHSSPFSTVYTGNKQTSAEEELEMNSMDDDLFGLLKNFQEMPVPDWYHKRGQSLGLETHHHHHHQQDASLLGSIDQPFSTHHDSFWRN